MDGACSAYGGEEGYTGLWWGNLWERDHLKDPSVDGRIILRSIFGKWDGDIDWIDLAQDRERLRALVIVVMNPRMRGIS